MGACWFWSLAPRITGWNYEAINALGSFATLCAFGVSLWVICKQGKERREENARERTTGSNVPVGG